MNLHEEFHEIAVQGASHYLNILHSTLNLKIFYSQFDEGSLLFGLYRTVDQIEFHLHIPQDDLQLYEFWVFC